MVAAAAAAASASAAAVLMPSTGRASSWLVVAVAAAEAAAPVAGVASSSCSCCSLVAHRLPAAAVDATAATSTHDGACGHIGLAAGGQERCQHTIARVGQLDRHNGMCHATQLGGARPSQPHQPALQHGAHPWQLSLLRQQLHAPAASPCAAVLQLVLRAPCQLDPAHQPAVKMSASIPEK